MKLSRKVGVAAGALLAACAGGPGHVSGTVVSVDRTEIATETAARLELESGTIAGATEVTIIFDDDLPQCLDGDGVPAVGPGARVRAVAADFVDFESLDAMYPPSFHVQELYVACD